MRFNVRTPQQFKQPNAVDAPEAPLIPTISRGAGRTVGSLLIIVLPSSSILPWAKRRQGQNIHRHQ
jgi:hypothetical protein